MVTIRFARLFSVGRIAASLAAALAMILLPVSPLALLPLSTADASSGSVVINEFVSNPSSGSEWVEMYNATNSSIDLSGWTLEDTGAHTLSLSGSVAAHGFASFDFSGSVLNNAGDTITLINASNSTIDSVAYGTALGAIVTAPGLGESAGRAPDGSNNWIIFSTPSPDASNNGGTIEFTPTPPTSVNLGGMLSFSASSNDLAGPTYSVVTSNLSPLSNSPTINSTTGAFSWTPTFLDIASAPTFTIKATSGNYSESKTFSAAVEIGLPSSSDSLAVQSTSTPVGSPVTLSATLTGDIVGPSAPLPNEDVGFNVDGSPLGTSTTNVSGVATYTYTPSLLAGTYSIMAYSTPALFGSVSGSGVLTITGAAPACDVNGENGTHTALQDAVNAASAGATITVCAGTYPENVTIGKAIVLEGANAGLDPNVDTRSAESIINGSVTIKANNVAVNGFTIDPTSGSSVLMQGPYTGETIKDNVINDNGYAVNFNTGTTFITNNQIKYGTSPTTGIEANSTPGSDIHVSYNHFSGDASALPADITVIGGSPRSEDVFIANNTSTSGTTLAAIFNSRDVSITSNISTGAQGSAIYVGGGDSYVNVTGNTIAGAVDAIHVANDFQDGPSDNVTVSKNKIETSNATGLKVGASAYTANTAVAATGNWWGSATGPTDAVSGDGSVPDTNPGGTGSSALGAVAYGSWCTDASCSTLYNPTPAAPTGLYVQYGSDGTTLHDGDATNKAAKGGTWNLHWTSPIANNDASAYYIKRTCPDVGHCGASPYSILPNDSTPLYNFTQKGEGKYTYQVQVKNKAGVKSDWSAPITVIYDTQTPTIAFTAPTASSTVDITKPLTVTGTYQEHGLSGISRIQLYISKGYKYDYNNHLMSSPTTGYFTSILTKGNGNGTFTYTFTPAQLAGLASLGVTSGSDLTITAVAIDNAGNGQRTSDDWKESSETVIVGSPTPDVPTMTLADANGKNIPDNGYITTKDFVFTLSSSPSASRYQLKYWNTISGSAYNGEANAWNPTDLSTTGHMNTLGIYGDDFSQGEGTHDFAFSACDTSGDCSAYSTPFVVTYDDTPPAAPTLLSPADGAVVNGASVEQSWSDSDPSVNHYVYESFNNASATSLRWKQTFASTTLSKTATNVSNSTYWWRVEAMDAAGNVSTSPLWELTVDNSPVLTEPATSITSSDAILNGTNGSKGNNGNSFWVSTTPFVATSSNTLIPAGVYSTPVTSPAAAHTNFSATLSSLTAHNGAYVHGQGVGTMPTITPDTTYYFVAWSDTDQGWYPGAELSFKTGSGPLPPTPSVTTGAASSISMTDATLNGTNGLIGADAESFWVSTSTIDTSSDVLPKGVYSTPILSGIAAGASFSDPLSIVTTSGITTGQQNNNMPAITPNTTYYYVAWVNVGGSWYPGAVQHFTTSSLPSVMTNTPATSIEMTSATVSGTNGSVAADNTSFWWGTTPITGTLSAGANPGATELPSGWTHDSGLGATTTAVTFSENLTGLTPNTTYYYVAWIQVGGTWYPGQVESFTTSAAPAVVSLPITIHWGDLATSLVDLVANPIKWAFSDDQAATPNVSNNLGSFVNGPTGVGLLGNGSAQFSVSNSSQGVLFGTPSFAGTPLSEVKALSYSTYRQSGDAAEAPALQFDINTNGTTTPATYEGRLVFEPYLTGATVATGAWQNWNAFTGQGWWFSHAATTPAPGKVVTTCTMATPCTLGDVLSKYPQLGISGVTGFKIGSGWNGFLGNVDNFTIETNDGIQDTTTTYNFEPRVGTVTTVTNANDLTNNASTVGTPVTVQWSVVPTPGNTGTPTGTVTVNVNGSTASGCSANVSLGQCSFTPSTSGSVEIYANYVGDNDFNESTSATIVHHVNAASNNNGSGSGGGTGGSGGNGMIPNTPLVGDLNHDGQVNFLDFAILMANMGKTGANIADLNGDHVVNAADLAILISHWTF